MNRHNPKLKRMLTVLAALALLSPDVHAGKVRFPVENPAQFTITLPDGWRTEVDRHGVLEAESPGEDGSYLAAWEVDDLDKLAELQKSLRHLLKDCAKKLNLSGPPVKLKVGMIPATLFTGTAQDADDGSPIIFHVLVLFTGPDDASVIYVQADADASKDEQETLKKIIRSVTSP